MRILLDFLPIALFFGGFAVFIRGEGQFAKYV